MASGENSGSQHMIAFDLFANNDESCDNILDGKLTQEEAEEITAIVEQLESVNSRELIDFCTPPEEHRHKQITADELDRLAAKNNAESTIYQTKWAVTIIKGTYQCFLFKFNVKNSNFQAFCSTWGTFVVEDA